MILFTSDPHFGHENIIKLCGRPFSDVGEMDECLIRRWNARVSDRDTVYILGDLFYRCPDPEAILMRLNGSKRLITGNHDESWLTKPLAEKYFDSVDLMLEINAYNRRITLCHYPLLLWAHDKRTYMIHGHIHCNTSYDCWPLIKARENLLNAGVDINGFEPVSLDELIENNAEFKRLH